ncbi:Protein kinase superfamily protein [Zea mays]|jgi:hypothetical protein|uniref:Protein kinase superfamily protein n=1 Tax=Zea mays TaxID=4577 RepID=A0A1D6QPW5_MAIZE|nr:Protein kinase superfamily protein [Zea mays]
MLKNNRTFKGILDFFHRSLLLEPNLMGVLWRANKFEPVAIQLFLMTYVELQTFTIAYREKISYNWLSVSHGFLWPSSPELVFHFLDGCTC